MERFTFRAGGHDSGVRTQEGVRTRGSDSLNLNPYINPNLSRSPRPFFSPKGDVTGSCKRGISGSFAKEASAESYLREQGKTEKEETEHFDTRIERDRKV